MITFSYENDGSSNNKTVNVKVYVDSESAPRDTFSVQGANTTDNYMTVKVNDDINYEIDRIEFDGGGNPAFPEMSSDLKSYSFQHTWGDVTANADPLELSVYLRTPLPKPDVPNGVYEGDGSVFFYLYEDQLLKMLHLAEPESTITANTEIESVFLNFTKNVGAGFASQYKLDWHTVDGNEGIGYYYSYGGISNLYNDVVPNNISSLVITYGNGQTATIPAGDLRCVKQEATGMGKYILKANNDTCYAVAFYEQGDSGLGNAGIFHLHDIVFVTPGGTVTEMPKDPQYTTHHFAGWSTEKSGGVPFNESYIVNSDMRVWAQKYSSQYSSSLIYVDNTDDAFLDRFVDLCNATHGTNITADQIKDSVKIQVNGINEEHTNPNYSTSNSQKTGWDNEKYAEYTAYKIYNYDADPEGTDPNASHYNKHIPFDEIQSITIFADVTLNDETVTVSFDIDKGSAPGEFSAVVSGYEGGTGSIDGVFWLKMNQGEADDPVVPPEPTPESDLSVTKDVVIPNGKETASVGDTLKYTITVTNSGDAAAEDVKVWDSMWGHEGDAVNTNPAIDNTSVADGFCIINSIPAGNSVSITYTYTVPEEKAGQTLTNNVWIGDDETPGDDDPKDDVTVTVDDLVYYNVNYHIVGDIGTSDWTVSVQAGTGYTYEVPDALPGYTFDGWYEKESDIGNADKKEPTTVTVNKKYEVYGKYVINTENPPEKPDEDAVIDLLGRCVQLKCDQVTDHKCGFALKEDSFTIGNCTENGNVWTVTVTVNADKYLEDYNNKGVGTHELADGETGTKDIVLTWDATANNNQGAWVRPAGDLLAIFDITCKPDAPTTDDLNKLFPNGVQVDCLTQGAHDNKDYDLEDNTYTATVEQENGQWICTVTVTGETYVEKYVNDIGWPHTANDDTRSVTLVWENGKWAKQDNNNVMVVFDVTCQAPGAPTYDQLKGLFKVQIDCITSDKWGDQYKHKNKDYAPIEDSYTLGNVTANADGTWDLEVTVAAEKYVAQYSVDRNETHTLADAYSSKTVTLVYQNGAWTKLGDDIAFTFDVKCNPEYDLVYYGCGGLWGDAGTETVSSTFPYFGEATIKNNQFVRDGYVFEGWALTDGGDVVYTGGEDVIFNDETFPGLSTAKKAELYAVWALDKQGEIDPDTGEETGDGIADYRQVFVRYKSADATLGSVDPTYQVVTLDLDENGDPIVVDISLDSVATANEGAEFIYWMQGPENTVSYEASLKNAGLTLKNYTPGYTYEFTAYFMDSDIGKPEPVQTYKIDVDVTNGTGTFFGTEVTTHILAMAGDDITIAFAPDAGYALDTVTVDGQPAVLTADGTYTFTKVAANHSITVVYATDAWNDKDDTTTGGDGIPDKYQVVVKYVADKGGKITGKQVEVLTIYDADGHYSIVGDVTATGSQAAAFHNWDFSRWVAPNGGVADWNPILGQQTIEDAEGGKTYVFTAHFRYDPYIPPVVNPDPDDPTPPPVNPNPPQLNTEDHYAYIVGYEDGTVRPEGDITRAEVATIFFRLLTDESRNEYWSQTNDYTDVAEGDWYNNAVSTLSKAGILNGYEDGSFQPNGNITRAEFATIAARFFEATYEGEDLFPDIEGHWARDYINQAAHAGIVNGYEDGTFRPQENITRAEAMTIVNRTLDRHPDADHFLADMITWPDNLETAWYYEQVQEATNSHEYVMKTDADKNPYEIWKEILPVRDWSDLENTWSEAHAG